MLAAHRRDLLLRRLREDGRLVAKDLAVELGVSEDSVRRDLRELASAGLVQRVYGGALPVSAAVVDYAARAQVQPESKERVARAAARLVTPGSTVLLDGGTTTLAVTRALPLDLRATVITHSPTIAVALAEHVDIDVQIIGGRLYRHSMVACGALAVEAAQRIGADLFLLGVTGVHPETGLTTGDADEAAMKRALAARAAETYVLASAEKVGAASPYQVLGLTDVAGILTDAPEEDPVVARLRAAGAPVVVVG
ncbi:DeoR/GlpR family DNA-binding transcription regulator [Cellulomonas soli]|uniref:Lactose phosphotransferase system repressor n=1 Tax=Cellulomonas soli TaxID=931535 RepID=A0A512PCW5_9CELL|nr:DeoR/GlpR family DNA-binding transcription regulator [Cellulomonas soli]NYI58624.1 DeoR/GlpR family transcriptional regulator of sugar metabolism [Cellulomonas soli]GEP69049.1 DeoR family transcriptional regulator [Cellulomonas soli]